MKMYGIWHGGASYTPGGVDDLEEFASLTDAKQALVSRYESDGVWLQDFHFIDRGHERVYTPRVTSDSEMWIFFSAEGDCSYPDRRIFLGPRGGVRVETC